MVLFDILGWSCGPRVAMQFETLYFSGALETNPSSWNLNTVKLCNGRYLTMLNGPLFGQFGSLLQPSKNEQAIGFCSLVKFDRNKESPLLPVGDATVLIDLPNSVSKRERTENQKRELTMQAHPFLIFI
jgi:hypothetical protein